MPPPDVLIAFLTTGSILVVSACVGYLLGRIRRWFRHRAVQQERRALARDAFRIYLLEIARRSRR